MRLKLLSWNIWCGTHLEKVIEFLKAADADIIALQEASEDDRGNIAEIVARKIGYHYTHAIGMPMPVKFLPHYEKDENKVIKYGPAILSKYKIMGGRAIELTNPKSRLVEQADILVESNPISVFSVHLLHTHQKQSLLQDEQAENLLKLVPKEKAIIMGDFNSLPESTVISKMRQELQEAEAETATPTWSVYKEGCTTCLIGEVKHTLDYIFTTKDISVLSREIHQSKASDHLPISAIVEL